MRASYPALCQPLIILVSDILIEEYQIFGEPFEFKRLPNAFSPDIIRKLEVIIFF